VEESEDVLDIQISGLQLKILQVVYHSRNGLLYRLTALLNFERSG
jgi:hypothetical protein